MVSRKAAGKVYPNPAPFIRVVSPIAGDPKTEKSGFRGSKSETPLQNPHRYDIMYSNSLPHRGTAFQRSLL